MTVPDPRPAPKFSTMLKWTFGVASGLSVVCLACLVLGVIYTGRFAIHPALWLMIIVTGFTWCSFLAALVRDAIRNDFHQQCSEAEVRIFERLDETDGYIGEISGNPAPTAAARRRAALRLVTPLD